MVQKPPRRHRDEDGEAAQNHARDCVAHGTSDATNVIDCLYLYREFSSEALRILVPYTRSGMDETVLQSFMAALQLGLKRRFGGRVDHLRITTQQEPDPDGGGSRQYVLIYDSVPGGTGYLQQLLSEDAQSLSDVLRLAHAAVSTCSCRELPDKDGCYRCVYQYRLGRAMASVSRSVAAQVLGDLVGSLEGLARVASISQVLINPNFESVLESQFIESLRRLGGARPDGANVALPAVRLVQEIVEGVSGYLLEVAGQRWWIKPQVHLGPGDGVKSHCRPDFLFIPAKPGSARRAIAVFADGWTHHQNSLRDDARKRSALVASGRYWVWSVTWEDVQRALDGDIGIDLDVLEAQSRLAANHDLVAKIASSLSVPATRARENAVAQLIRFLSMEPPVADRRLAAQAAVAVGRLAINPSDAAAGVVRRSFDKLVQSLPEGALATPATARPVAGSELVGPLKILSTLMPGYVSGRVDEGCGAVMLDAALAPDGASLRQAWRGWLQTFNLLQALPNHFLVEASGQQHGDYADLRHGSVDTPAHAAEDERGPWADVLANVLSELVEGVRSLQAGGCPAPAPAGYEKANEAGEVEAEAELAWPQQRIVVLATHQSEHAQAWTRDGWRVVLAGDGSWADTVRRALEGTE
jgi:DEAD/DEAH box helicase domain-containing protein